MKTSFGLGAGALTCILLAWVAGCAREGASTSETSAPTARFTRLRILDRKVNLMEPLDVATDGDLVTITYARRGRDGLTLSVDPVSLETRSTRPHVFAAHPTPRVAPCIAEASTFTGSLPNVDVVGAPRVAVVASGRTIAVFFMSDEEGIALAAAPLAPR